MKQTYDNPQSPLYSLVRAQDGTRAADSMGRITPHTARQIGQAAHDLGMPELTQQLQRQTVERLLDPPGNGTPDLKNLPSRFGRAQKEQLNGVLTPEQLSDVEKLARTSKVVHADSNISGSGKVMQAVSDSKGMLAGATEAATALALGHPEVAAAGAIPFAAAGANHVVSKALTNPDFVGKMVDPPPAPPPMPPVPAINVVPAAVSQTGEEQQDGADSPPTPEQPTISEKTVVPAEASKGVQEVKLPTVDAPAASATDHPAGKVTGFDEDTGLPIVKRGAKGADATPADSAPKPAESDAPAPQSSASPGPETHVFSLGQWQEANPGGDTEAAAAEAKNQGYEVGE
jgi:hypothetical protein